MEVILLLLFPNAPQNSSMKYQLQRLFWGISNFNLRNNSAAALLHKGQRELVGNWKYAG